MFTTGQLVDQLNHWCEYATYVHKTDRASTCLSTTFQLKTVVRSSLGPPCTTQFKYQWNRSKRGRRRLVQFRPVVFSYFYCRCIYYMVSQPNSEIWDILPYPFIYVYPCLGLGPTALCVML